jgi:hypothetical protein
MILVSLDLTRDTHPQMLLRQSQQKEELLQILMPLPRRVPLRQALSCLHRMIQPLSAPTVWTRPTLLSVLMLLEIPTLLLIRNRPRAMVMVGPINSISLDTAARSMEDMDKSTANRDLVTEAPLRAMVASTQVRIPDMHSRATLVLVGPVAMAAMATSRVIRMSNTTNMASLTPRIMDRITTRIPNSSTMVAGTLAKETDTTITVADTVLRDLADTVADPATTPVDLVDLAGLEAPTCSLPPQLEDLPPVVEVPVPLWALVDLAALADMVLALHTVAILAVVSVDLVALHQDLLQGSAL